MAMTRSIKKEQVYLKVLSGTKWSEYVWVYVGVKLRVQVKREEANEGGSLHAATVSRDVSTDRVVMMSSSIVVVGAAVVVVGGESVVAAVLERSGVMVVAVVVVVGCSAVKTRFS